MPTKIWLWYSHLSNTKQLLILFFSEWLFWFLTGFLLEIVWPAEYDDNPGNLIEILGGSLFMAILGVLLCHFNKVKRLFKKKPVKSSSTDT